MSAERELEGVEYEIERHLGKDWRAEYRNAAEALEAIFRHEARAGRSQRSCIENQMLERANSVCG